MNKQIFEGDIFYIVKDENAGILKKFFWFNQATSFAEDKKKEYMRNYDKTRVWVETNRDTEIIYEAKGYENEETEEFE